ncbi:hypothetical protein P7C70_g1749, partial [Phenoliferia sp. Uapishka_3]
MSGGAVSVIDLARLKSQEELAAAVKEALQSTGFIFIKNHGMEDEVAAMFPISGLCTLESPANYRLTYSSLSENFFANETEEEKVLSAIGFNIGYLAAGPPPAPTQRLPRLFAQHASTLATFQQKCFDFCQRLLEAFAIAIDLEPNFFSFQHSHDVTSNSILRFLHYPAVPPHTIVDPNRAGAHSDYGSLTLLFQRSAGGEGLQILPSSEPLDSDNWQDVGVVEGALLVNIGDALEFWSGAVFKSTLHRVRLPTPIPEAGIPERFSIAWFNQPSPEAVFRCVVKTSDISENDLERMKRKGATPGVEITSDDHLQARLKATYQL